MKFHQNISTRCKIINILVFCEYVYKVKLAVLGLNVNNFAMSIDILMKLSHYLRAAAAVALDADAGGNDVRTINHLATQARQIVHQCMYSSQYVWEVRRRHTL